MRAREWRYDESLRVELKRELESGDIMRAREWRYDES
jgi:hypothetical protein